MRVGELIQILAACFLLSCTTLGQEILPSASPIPPSATPENSQDFSEVVIPIMSMGITASMKLGITGTVNPGIGMNAHFGTGFCLDAECGFIASNYHVAVLTKTRKIQHEKIIQRYFATGPKDNGATPNFIPNVGVVPYSRTRDLAIYELERPLGHHHGLNYNLDGLRVGQQVDIYGYVKQDFHDLHHLKRKLRRFAARFKAPTTRGLLGFEYESFVPVDISGASGGIVVDRKTAKVVGVLCGTSQTVAEAVPVQTLVEFVAKVQPFLAERIFPAPAIKEVSPVSTDLYPKFVPARSDGLQHRAEEPYEVQMLRQKAQLLADSIRDFIAVQSLAWGSGDKNPDAKAAYEVRVFGGHQWFRSYPDGKKELEHVAYPHLKAWALTADEWSQLPKMVGTEYRLKINQAPDAVMNGRRTKVFQYYASVEDNLCPFGPVEDFGFFVIQKIVAVACYGEVWTDEAMNILRMSEQLDLSDRLKAYRGWEEYQTIVTYGSLTRPHEPPRLAPLTIYNEASDKKHRYWCRGHFTDYQVFGVEARLIAK